MPWEIQSAQKAKRGTKLRGAVIVFVNPDVLDDEGNPITDTKRWGYSQAQTAPKKAAFKKMLIGTGTLANPGGELKAWLDHMNQADDTTEPL